MLDIDVIVDEQLRGVTFTDDGRGMNADQLFKMLR
jgi:HSP90 family molecular chaperone